MCKAARPGLHRPPTMHDRLIICPCNMQGQRAINSKDSATFWWTLYVFVRALHPLPADPLLCTS